jgi:hypothetical protein
MESELRRRRRWPQILFAAWLAATLGLIAAITWAPQILYVIDWLVWSFGWLTVLSLLVLAAGWLLLPIWALVAAARRACRGAWRDAARAACGPLFAVLAVLYGREAGEFVRFRIERPQYVAAIEAARAGHPSSEIYVDVGPPTFAYFIWGGMVWGTSGVAYDETDEAGMLPESRSASWRERQGKSELACDAQIRPLGDHFYMVRAGC